MSLKSKLNKLPPRNAPSTEDDKKIQEAAEWYVEQERAGAATPVIRDVVNVLKEEGTNVSYDRLHKRIQKARCQ